MTVPAEEVDLIDVSPEQIWSVTTAMIPFLEHDDANRALMGSNMQAQAVPLLVTDAPLVGTGMERRAAIDTGDVVVVKSAGTVSYVDAEQMVVDKDGGGQDEYLLQKFMRSNQGTLIHQKPIIDVGTKVDAGEVLADGSATDAGEMALGKNLLVAFMSWEGYNFEDAIICPGGSSRTTSSPRSTSRSTRSTPARPSSATRRSPAISRTARRSRCATSTTAESSASAPRSAPGTCWSARSRRRARQS